MLSIKHGLTNFIEKSTWGDVWWEVREKGSHTSYIQIKEGIVVGLRGEFYLANWYS